MNHVSDNDDEGEGGDGIRPKRAAARRRAARSRRRGRAAAPPSRAANARLATGRAEMRASTTPRTSSSSSSARRERRSGRRRRGGEAVLVAARRAARPDQRAGMFAVVAYGAALRRLGGRRGVHRRTKRSSEASEKRPAEKDARSRSPVARGRPFGGRRPFGGLAFGRGLVGPLVGRLGGPENRGALLPHVPGVPS